MASVRLRLVSISQIDRWLICLLATLALGTRLPLATRMLYSWDSVNFAFGMQQFDVTHHAPHPPGYLYYVGLAKLLDLVIHDANTSLVLLSILFTCLSAIALFLLGRAAFDHATGFIAALLLLGSVTFWTYGIIALSYMTLAFFSIATAWLAYLVVMRGARQWLLAVTIVYSIGGGFRPDLLLFLAPLWLACLVRASWRQRLLNVVLAVCGFGLWFLPTVWLSGGLDKYLAVLSAYFSRDVLDRYSVMRVGGVALAANLRDLGSYVFYALYAETILLAAATAWLFWRGEWRRNYTWAFVAGWISPMLAFYTFVHIGDPGYVFAFLPACSLLCARFVMWAWRRDRGPMRPLVNGWSGKLAGLGLIAVVLTNAVIFLAVDKPLTSRGIQRHDHALAAKIAYIRSSYTPDEVVLLSYASYKHTLYYLPDYHHTLWVDRFSRHLHRDRLPADVHYAVILDDDLPHIVRRRDRWQMIPLSSDTEVYRLEVQPEQRLVYGDAEIEVDQDQE